MRCLKCNDENQATSLFCKSCGERTELKIGYSNKIHDNKIINGKTKSRGRFYLLTAVITLSSIAGLMYWQQSEFNLRTDSFSLYEQVSFGIPTSFGGGLEKFENDSLIKEWNNKSQYLLILITPKTSLLHTQCGSIVDSNKTSNLKILTNRPRAECEYTHQDEKSYAYTYIRYVESLDSLMALVVNDSEKSPVELGKRIVTTIRTEVQK